MYSSTVLSLVAAASSSLLVAVHAQNSTYSCDTPLASKRFEYDSLPYQVDTCDGDRGRQVGYNQCNSTTAGPTSLCQTAIVNSIDDFCLWGPQEPGEVVGNIEGEMVAWCTRGDLHGARQIPAGALTGVQFMRAKNYIQVTGIIKQDLIDIAADDDGGELDPHGADQRGNPLGALVFSNAFGSNTTSNGTNYQQVIQWHNFMGGGQFCLKACDPSYAEGYRMCEHIYDRAGCGVNAPAAYQDGVFDSCEGDDQLFPGVYVENGVTMTWTQPPEGQAIGQLPYSVFTPASSSCTTYQSAEIYTAALAASSSASASASTTSGASSAATPTSGAASSATGSNPSQSGAASAGQSGAAPSASPASSAERVVAGGALAAAIGVVAAALF